MEDKLYFEMDCPCKGKYLDKMLQPAILTLLYRENLHGFILIQKLSENPMFAGTLPDKTGVYRYLKKMEASELLESDWELDDDGGKPRRIYTITEKGRHCLANWLEALKRYSFSIGELIREIERQIG